MILRLCYFLYPIHSKNGEKVYAHLWTAQNQIVEIVRKSLGTHIFKEVQQQIWCLTLAKKRIIPMHQNGKHQAGCIWLFLIYRNFNSFLKFAWCCQNKSPLITEKQYFSNKNRKKEQILWELKNRKKSMYLSYYLINNERHKIPIILVFG